MPKTDTQRVTALMKRAQEGLELDRLCLNSIIGPIDTELLRDQRNHLLHILNVDIEQHEINEKTLNGIVNLLDRMLDVLDLHTGA